MQSKVYDAETIIDGRKIGKPGGYYVAIPESYKGFRICVFYKGTAKVFEDWLKADAYRRFPDKWGRGIYTLAYFKFKDSSEEQLKIDNL